RRTSALGQGEHSTTIFVRAPTLCRFPHAVLAGMFGRRPQAKVCQHYSVSTAAIDGRGLKLDVFVRLWNEGPAIARDAFMHLLIEVPKGGSRKSFQADPDET